MDKVWAVLPVHAAAHLCSVALPGLSRGCQFRAGWKDLASGNSRKATVPPAELQLQVYLVPGAVVRITPRRFIRTSLAQTL